MRPREESRAAGGVQNIAVIALPEILEEQLEQRVERLNVHVKLG